MQNLFRITKVADMIFEKGAVKFGRFKLNQNTPLFPFVVNLHTCDNLTCFGPLTQIDCNFITHTLTDVIFKNRLSVNTIAGIPYSADPFVSGVEIQFLWSSVNVVKLSKTMEGEKCKIVMDPKSKYEEGKEVLVIDDMLTKADFKLRAIHVLESQKMIVKNIAVVIDLQQGGKEDLEKAGYNLISCFTITDLLSYYLQDGRISESKYQECLEYIQNN